MDSQIIVPHLTVGSFHTQSVGSEITAPGTVTVAANNWVANDAIFVPVVFPFMFPLRFWWWVNGSTITTSNVDVGLYTLDGTRIASIGSTALSGASARQTVAMDRIIPSGQYLMAYACNNTTARVTAATITAIGGRIAGLKQMSSAFPLPATATLAQFAGTIYPVFGVSGT